MLFPALPDPRRSVWNVPRAARRPRFLLHDDMFDHEHMSEEAQAKAAAYIASQETVTLTTVGIDVGSSTSHLLFAKIYLEREAQELSSRFVVVAREVIYRSPIMLTPFTPDGNIDAARLQTFFRDAYEGAGLRPADIDSGAVILTGEAIKKHNARAIDTLFADEAGKFVCATAGHHLEATLAAHGSGAVKYSRDRNNRVLHVDIGGGTTKLALIDRGRVHSVSAFAVGGRLLATDATGAWTRLDDSARMAAEDLGVPHDSESLADPQRRKAIAHRLAGIALDYVVDHERDELGRALLLTDELDRSLAPDAITFSGGVAEYLFGREKTNFGDIARDLADRIRTNLAARVEIPIVDPGVGIRATVIGASSFTVQVSGKTIYLSDPAVLPLRGVPVMHVPLPERIDVGVEQAIHRALARSGRDLGDTAAVAFAWTRDPDYHDLIVLCRALKDVFAPDGRRDNPLILLVDGDVGKTIGHLLADELHLTGAIVSIDGVSLDEFDFVDVGALMNPPGVIPLVIKSLVFS